jgi:cellulose synthase/poly-beta-1,6-N-acetylglucosamine synthase-like glycosyltransferase
MQYKNILEIIDSAGTITVDGGPMLSGWLVSYEEDEVVFEWGEDDQDYEVVISGEVLRDPTKTFLDENIIKTTDVKGYRTTLKLYALATVPVADLIEY